jgi:hypothetical protein
MDELTVAEKRENALKDVKMYMANDWELKEETPEFFLLTRSRMSFGKHLVLFIFTWWTLGLANVLVHFLVKQKKKIVK